MAQSLCRLSPVRQFATLQGQMLLDKRHGICVTASPRQCSWLCPSTSMQLWFEKIDCQTQRQTRDVVIAVHVSMSSKRPLRDDEAYKQLLRSAMQPFDEAY